MIRRLAARARGALGPSFAASLRAQRGHWDRGATFVLSFDVETKADCEAVPRVLEVLRARRIPASFACIGALVDRYPDEHRAIAAAGHEILDHTDTHPSHDELGTRERFDRLDDAEIEREVVDAARKIAALGTRALGFRSPHFGAMHTSRVYPVLRRHGFAYSSSVAAHATAHGGAPYLADGVWEFPLTGCPRHRGALLDSWHCTTAPDAAHRGAGLASLYREALAEVETARAFASVYWDPRVALLDEYAPVLDLIAGLGSRARVARYADLVSGP